jgi:hypothetical protein
MSERTTDAPVEVVYEGTPKARTTDAPVEVIYAGTPKARTTLAVVEVVYVVQTGSGSAQAVWID